MTLGGLEFKKCKRYYVRKARERLVISYAHAIVGLRGVVTLCQLTRCEAVVVAIRRPFLRSSADGVNAVNSSSVWFGDLETVDCFNLFRAPLTQLSLTTIQPF